MTVWVQSREKPADGLDLESSLVYQYCTMERLRARSFTPSQMLGDQIDLAGCELVVGSVQCVSHALARLDRPVTSSPDYPDVLRHRMYRNTWLTTAGEILSTIASDNSIFAKSVACKAITGQTFSPVEGSSLLLEVDPSTPMWASDIVSWLSEYRVYVQNNEIIATSLYSGNDKEIDIGVVKEAVKLMAESPDTVSTYAFDWGVLSTGETALIEMNDAWAIGAYSMNYRDYYNFLKAGWAELTSSYVSMPKKRYK